MCELPACTGWPKKLYIFQHTISLEPFEIIRSGFHQNVPKVSGNNDQVAIFMQLLHILSNFFLGGGTHPVHQGGFTAHELN